MTRVDLPVPLMRHDPDRSWITDPDHPKGMQPKCLIKIYLGQNNNEIIKHKNGKQLEE